MDTVFNFAAAASRAAKPPRRTDRWRHQNQLRLACSLSAAWGDARTVQEFTKPRLICRFSGRLKLSDESLTLFARRGASSRRPLLFARKPNMIFEKGKRNRAFDK